MWEATSQSNIAEKESMSNKTRLFMKVKTQIMIWADEPLFRRK